MFYLTPPERVENAISAVAEVCGISVEDILSRSRVQTVERSRALLTYVLRETTALSFPEIGKRLGRCGSTAYSACRRIRIELRRDVMLPELLARVMARIKAVDPTPTPLDLWIEAGRPDPETKRYAEYVDLMAKHGHVAREKN